MTNPMNFTGSTFKNIRQTINGYNIKEKYFTNLVKPSMHQTRTRDNLIDE